MTVDNPMIAKMRAGETAIGLGVTLPPAAQVPMFARQSGFDWAFIDLEHTLLSPETVATLAHLLALQQITPLARIPKNGLFDVARLLDSGVSGIIRPHVETSDEARELVQLCKYAPLGQRSWGGASPQLGYPQKPSGELMEAGNAATLAAVMIESARGIDAIDDIVGVHGLDAVLIGCVDLSIDLGVMGRSDAPQMVDAIARIGCATRAAGKYFGLAGASSPAVLTRDPEGPVDFALVGMDYRILAAALGARAAQWRAAPDAGTSATEI
ncbi:HpcH/HpaI aldolase family protein [Pseudohoeflea coraliihabitans]|uniref:HpcH/HpaI aldolase/citrate lyase domain-containing protein n=1 Tax=Pseudohoeflea coraliihabitans TaxID=2860393 RepID=A0ABS6WM72_9HYPH|nr:aldolase/citrate lyase family protein [Pseudohoeflea sp. DP4N28-3]MBW3097048.1 hypothetical protein [Pseudohoeflea sp. DP4N28-3]